MIHHEGTKSTKDTKASAMVLSHAVVGAAIEVHLHQAQVLTYLRLTCCPVGLLVNFNVDLLRSG